MKMKEMEIHLSVAAHQLEMTMHYLLKEHSLFVFINIILY